MKLLQIKNTEDGKPRVLEMGRDFVIIYDNKLYNQSPYKNFEDAFACNLSDCYKSRPLIQIDGYCEFDVQKRIAINEPDLEYSFFHKNGQLTINDLCQEE